MTISVGICAERLQHIRRHLPSDNKLSTGTIRQLYIFHAGKARAVALDHIHQAVITVRTGKDTGFERLVPCCF